ncbi:hypothetical protein CA13_66490 [Planctomycetes bacterium CA13]|uniref:Uncharacterized protein n=1 Tax=Novipirellula herctigrandis TaxID=2527986 RepID=A0A5C5ZDL9_9BACT|nr:hypothetical protein CA13_66490 [Planctomycetes bacterium CA13]
MTDRPPVSKVLDSTQSLLELQGLWEHAWQWFATCMKTQGWPELTTSIGAPASEADLSVLSRHSLHNIPQTFLEACCSYSSAVTFHLPWPPEGSPAVLKYDHRPDHISNAEIGGKMMVWSLQHSIEHLDGYLDYCDANLGATPSLDPIFANTVPVIAIDNGDYVALNLDDGCVYYMSKFHDPSMTCKRLGYDFWDYIGRISMLGCPVPTCFPDSGFYDSENQVIALDSTASNDWINWLETYTG